MVEIQDKYKPLFTSNSRYFVVTGGRGSGKSFSINAFLSLLMLEENQKILFLRQTLTSAYISIIPEFVEKIELLKLGGLFEITKTEIICPSTGSSILFRGIQTGSKSNTANLKSLQGITALVIDEAEEVTDETAFDRIDLSVRQKGIQNRVILAMNPSTKEHFIYKRFFEGEGVEPGFNGIKGNSTYIHGTYLDNIDNLDESFINQVDRIKDTNPAKYDHVILGGWLDKAEGVVLTNWKIGEFKEIAKSIYGQDFGFSVDPTTLVQTSIDKANKRIYIKECVYAPKLTTSDIVKLNHRYAGDSLIYADSAEPRLIAELKDMKCNIVEAKKGQGSISAGIAILQDYELIIDPNSTNIVKELNNYVWNDKKSGTPVDAYNHAIDSIRYAIYSQMANKFEFAVF
jgi:phage terminase large subunit